MTEKQAVAAMMLATDAAADPYAPPVLKLAAVRYIYRGEGELFLSLLREAAVALGLSK